MDFVFEQIRVGGDRNFGYLIGDRRSKAAVLVDPSYTPEVMVERASAQGLKVVYVLNTHGHDDHTNGNAKVGELTGAMMASDFGMSDGHELGLGDRVLRILAVPGHTQDHVAIYEPEFGLLLTGDHLFVGKVGGTADAQSARQEYDSLQKLMDELPGETTVWPGHDYGCRPSSTLALEKATNPFLQCENFEAFLELKETWATYKAKNGLR